MATVQSARSAITWRSGPFNVIPKLTAMAICLSPVIQAAAAKLVVKHLCPNCRLNKITHLSRIIGCSFLVLKLCLMITLTQHHSH